MRAGALKRVAWSLAALLAVACLLAPLRSRVYASDRGEARDRIGVFSSIVVTEDRPAGDVACLFCSVTIDGDVHGDVAVMFGSVMVSDGRTISGDVATLFSSLVLGEGSRVNGDLATVMGSASLAETAHVGGDRSVLASGLGITVILAPLLIVIGVIWLLVWGARRILV